MEDIDKFLKIKPVATNVNKGMQAPETIPDILGYEIPNIATAYTVDSKSLISLLGDSDYALFVYTPSDLSALFVNNTFYDRLIRSNSKFKFIDRTDECVLCGADSSNLVNINDLRAQYGRDEIKSDSKHWQSFPNSKFVGCKNCWGLFTDVVPNAEMLEFLYQYMYEEQHSGERRFDQSFFTDDFNQNAHIILEIGGGISGIKEKCAKKTYYSLDFNNQSDIRQSIDLIDDNDINKIKKWEIDTVVSCDCIEHILYPKKFIETCYKILPPSGRLYLQIGQYHSLDSDVSVPEYIQVPHINHFTNVSMSEAINGKFRSLTDLSKIESAYVLERI